MNIKVTHPVQLIRIFCTHISPPNKLARQRLEKVNLNLTFSLIINKFLEGYSRLNLVVKNFKYYNKFHVAKNVLHSLNNLATITCNLLC